MKKTELVDVDAILFSIPTISAISAESAGSIEYVMPTEIVVEDAIQFHEDMWSQLEFYPRTRLKELQQILEEYKAFEAKSRAESGWKEIYLRKA